MKRARGFKGRYFRLAAMTALHSQIEREREEHRCRRLHRSLSFPAAAAEGGEEDPPEEPIPHELYTATVRRMATKACHCNCVFRRKFRRLWHLYKFFFTPPGRYVKTKTGTSPPILSFF